MTDQKLTTQTVHCVQMYVEPHLQLLMVQYLLERGHDQQQVLTAEECEYHDKALNQMVDLTCENYHSTEVPMLPLSQTNIKLWHHG